MKRKDIYCVYQYETQITHGMARSPIFMAYNTASLREVCEHNLSGASYRRVPLFFGTYDECCAWQAEYTRRLATEHGATAPTERVFFVVNG